MIKMSAKNKLKLAEGLYIMVVAIMISFIFIDTNKINFGSQVSAEDSSMLTNSQEATGEYNKYFNQKCGFSIDYPSTFTVLKDDNNGYGISFYSEDNSIKATAYGANNIPYESTELLLKKDLSIIDGNIVTKNLNKDWYVISWNKNGTVYYRKVIAGTESLYSLVLSYPENSSDISKSIISHIIVSFKPGNLDTAH